MKKKFNMFNIIFWLLVIGGVTLVGCKVYQAFQPINVNEEGRTMVYADISERMNVVDEILEITEEDTAPSLYYKIPFNISNTMGEPPMTIRELIFGNKVVKSVEEYILELNKERSGADNERRWRALATLKTKEDEVIDPDEAYHFNKYVSIRKVIDSLPNETLTKEEVNKIADAFTQLTCAYDNEFFGEECSSFEIGPYYFYIKDLINKLENKNPTKSSIAYLLIANGVELEKVSSFFLGESEGIYVRDYNYLFDNTYVGEQENSIVKSYTTKIEIIDEDTGIIHLSADDSMTYYQNVMETFTLGWAHCVHKNGSGDNIIAINHYKDISNDFIAENYIIVLNSYMDETTETLVKDYNRSFYTNSKSNFNWCISPKIEEIASAYYDIVEPAVYAGTYINFADAYQKTYEALEGKYTLEEIESAVMTYEFWALNNYAEERMDGSYFWYED